MSLWLATGWVTLIALSAIVATIIYYMWTGKINLARLISEPNGDASMSRFQLLVFTLVVAFALFIITMSGDKPSFPESIPSSVLTLLGISASSYLVSKGIQFSAPDGGKHEKDDGSGDDGDDEGDAPSGSPR